MKKLLWILLTVITTLSASAPSPVPHVDPERFSGLWYEIARTPNDYEEGCFAATVEYRLTSPTTYDVFNRCFEGSMGGELIEYSGTAEPSEGKSMSRIDMTYYWFFTRQYRVIHISPDYHTAVVTDEKMQQVWIMHRQPFMAQDSLENILALLEPHMDLKRLIYTPQDEQGRYK